MKHLVPETNITIIVVCLVSSNNVKKNEATLFN